MIEPYEVEQTLRIISAIALLILLVYGVLYSTYVGVKRFIFACMKGPSSVGLPEAYNEAMEDAVCFGSGQVYQKHVPNAETFKQEYQNKPVLTGIDEAKPGREYTVFSEQTKKYYHPCGICGSEAILIDFSQTHRCRACGAVKKGDAWVRKQDIPKPV